MKNFLLCICLLCSGPISLYAQLKVSKLFSDNAVLQRDMEIPIWGMARPEAQISIQFDQYQQNIVADAAGMWESKLPEMKAGGPFTLKISSGEKVLKFSNILIGDVWLCSGQSNMEWVVSASNNADEEIAKALDDGIRHFKIPATYHHFPQDTLIGGSWKVCNRKTVGNFTAVGYYFAREIRKYHDVPIGLLNSSWGGSRIEPWIRSEKLGYKNARESADFLQAYIDSVEQKTIAELKKIIEILPEEDQGMKEEFALWASENYNHQAWKTMELPGTWESKGYKNLDGIVWFRKEIYLTKEEANSDILLSLGAIDDADITYLNGTQIGATNAYNLDRNYKVVADILKEGANILAVRVTDNGWGGGFTGTCNNFYYKTSKKQSSLCGEWYFNIGKVSLNNVIMPNQFPTLLYNQMINPIVGYPIKGALWYQGESNASKKDAKPYQQLFSTMIQDWRQLWGYGDFPFLWVQLAGWKAGKNDDWPTLRASQNQTLNIPNTAQAVTIDIGDRDDIHPRNKQDVGLRLALAARNLAYGEDLIYAGPIYRNMEIEQNRIRLHFELNGSTLKLDHPDMAAFEIAGADKKFYPAKVKIDPNGQTMVVWNEQIKNPVAVRYAWADYPEGSKLYNQEDIPASPFRTDNW